MSNNENSSAHENSENPTPPAAGNRSGDMHRTEQPDESGESAQHEREHNSPVEGVCPVCGHDMSEHEIDHSTPDPLLKCPVRVPPKEEPHSPIDELGMTGKRGEEKAARHQQKTHPNVP
ncbi:hypothetical protein GCM10027416_31700 [Okibacterium endophyticum]